MKVSAVINTYNEERNLDRCLKSVADFADEIIVVDMHSSDKTVEYAKKYKAKIFYFEQTRYVEPARNFALSKAGGDWIFLIDADEELSKSLAEELKRISEENKVDFVEIPRKNIIFNKWIEHSRWWPDYLVRFFKKGKVNFSEKIHEPPKTQGLSLRLEASEKYSLIHYNIQSVSQYLERIDRYSDIQSEELIKAGYKFNWQDLISRPSSEFLSRYFPGEGYKDGLHGLVLGLLQAFSELTVYLKVWERQGFEQQETKNVDQLITEQSDNLLHWRIINTPALLSKIVLKIKKRL